MANHQLPSMESAKRKKYIVEMIQKGMNLPEIAATLKLTPQRVGQILKKATVDVYRGELVKARAAQLQQLADLEQHLYRVLNTKHPFIQKGEAVYAHVVDDEGKMIEDEDGNPITRQVFDSTPTINAARVLLLSMQRRSDLMGMDKPIPKNASNGDETIRIYEMPKVRKLAEWPDADE